MDIFCPLCPYEVYKGSEKVEFEEISYNPFTGGRIRVDGGKIELDWKGISGEYRAVNTFASFPLRPIGSAYEELRTSGYVVVDNLYFCQPGLKVNTDIKLFLLVLKNLSEKYNIPWVIPELWHGAHKYFITMGRSSSLNIEISTSEISKVFYLYVNIRRG